MRWALPLAVILSFGTGCTSSHFPETLEFDGQQLELFESRNLVRFVAGIYRLPGEHPATSNLTLGVMSASMRPQDFKLSLTRRSGSQRVSSAVHFETGDPTVAQLCQSYVDDHGQPVLALDVLEAGAERTLSTEVIWELDNTGELARTIELCNARRDKLGAMWVAHRTVFPGR